MRTLLLVLLFAAPSSAAVPYVTGKVDVDENFQYVERQIKKVATTVTGGYAQLSATQTFTGGNTFTKSVQVSSFTMTAGALFSGATSTTTFSGWVDIGWERLTCNSGGFSNECTTTCSAGKKVLGCGCQANGANIVYANYPSADDACRCYAATTFSVGAAICARVK